MSSHEVHIAAVEETARKEIAEAEARAAHAEEVKSRLATENRELQDTVRSLEAKTECTEPHQNESGHSSVEFEIRRLRLQARGASATLTERFWELDQHVQNFTSEMRLQMNKVKCDQEHAFARLHSTLQSLHEQGRLVTTTHERHLAAQKDQLQKHQQEVIDRSQEDSRKWRRSHIDILNAIATGVKAATYTEEGREKLVKKLMETVQTYEAALLAQDEM